MNQQDNYIAQLREAMEKKAGRQMHTPKDFDFLSESIFEELHQKVSATTLKRLWGYLQESSAPRTSTLDLLAQYVGYADWDSFCQQEDKPIEPIDQPEPNTPKSKHPIKWIAIALIAVAAIVLMFLLLGKSKPTEKPKDDKYVLRIGQTFKTPHDYLRVFGIVAKDSLWGRPIPHHSDIWTWGPMYHHPRWHNDGDSTKLLPTITEYWQHPSINKQAAERRNKDHYYLYKRLNELRITFVKNLVDTGYVFTGVYRMSIEQSDTTKTVWERVADEVDLDHLDYLENLRN
jgi:hypothetical protein